MNYADRLAAKLAEKGSRDLLTKPAQPLLSVMAVRAPATFADPDATFWKLRMIEGGNAWDVSTSPECTIAEARQLWPRATQLEGLA